MKRRKNKRGFTDRVYLANFICCNLVVVSIIILTALSGKLGITDMSALAAVPACAYAELAVHGAVVAEKSKQENLQKIKGSQVVELE